VFAPITDLEGCMGISNMSRVGGISQFSIDGRWDRYV